MPSSSSSIPSEFICPLTKKVMQHPMISKHGIHFDKAAIVEYLMDHRTCPVTRKPLAVGQLITDYSLWRRIRAFQGMSSVASEDEDDQVAMVVLSEASRMSSKNMHQIPLSVISLTSERQGELFDDWGSPFDLSDILDDVIRIVESP